jgi:hypothetical protein
VSHNLSRQEDQRCLMDPFLLRLTQWWSQCQVTKCHPMLQRNYASSSLVHPWLFVEKTLLG